MSGFAAPDPGFEARVRGSFARQALMTTVGARLTDVAPGRVEIQLPFREDLVQQHGFLHGGIVTCIADSACGYAALTMTPADVEVLTVEFKVNFLSPAKGGLFIARGRVTRAGRTLTVCSADVSTSDQGAEKLVATMLATLMAVPGLPAPR